MTAFAAWQRESRRLFRRARRRAQEQTGESRLIVHALPLEEALQLPQWGTGVTKALLLAAAASMGLNDTFCECFLCRQRWDQERIARVALLVEAQALEWASVSLICENCALAEDYQQRLQTAVGDAFHGATPVACTAPPGHA